MHFRDRSAATIASVALQKTAEIHSNIDPEAAAKINNDSYVDDIVSGIEDQEQYERITTNMTTIMSKGRFHHKGFVQQATHKAIELHLLSKFGCADNPEFPSRLSDCAGQ